MYQWIITLVNGKKYVVVNNYSDFIDFSKVLYGTESAKRVVSLHNLKTPMLKDIEGDTVKVSKVAIDCDKIVSIEW